MSGCIKNIDVNHTSGRNIGMQGISEYWRMEKKGLLEEKRKDQAVKRSRL
jgi:hypothetical protein